MALKEDNDKSLTVLQRSKEGVHANNRIGVRAQKNKVEQYKPLETARKIKFLALGAHRVLVSARDEEEKKRDNSHGKNKSILDYRPHNGTRDGLYKLQVQKD